MMPSSSHTQSIQFSRTHVQLFATPWTAAHQTSLYFTNSRSLYKLMSIKSLMPFNHLIFCCPFCSCLDSFPASGSFQMSQLFTSDGQSIGASASPSVLPLIIQDCFLSQLTGWVFLQSKGPSRVFSNTTVQKHQFVGAQLSPTLTSIHDYWKNHRFDSMDLYQQSNVSAF